jgi:dTDP-4-dehydrorhamnose 3,5-epimerase
MKVINTIFSGLKIIKQNSYKDGRGALRITHNQKEIKTLFKYEYCTTSKKNSLRGFHFQYKFRQAKYVIVLKGKILDVVIDLRKKSKTFGKSFRIILSAKNNLSLYIPAGFGHAYYSYENENIIYYKLNNYYKPKFEDGILAEDKDIKIKWPNGKKLISKKDKKLKTFKEFKQSYKFL